MATLSLRPRGAESPADIKCPNCRKLIWNASARVLLARVTEFPENGPAKACCKVCKTWVKVPVAAAGAAP